MTARALPVSESWDLVGPHADVVPLKQYLSEAPDVGSSRSELVLLYCSRSASGGAPSQHTHAWWQWTVYRPEHEHGFEGSNVPGVKALPLPLPLLERQN